MKTLLVEDNSITRQMVKRQFQALGHEVTACVDAETALKTYQQTFYPLIILDLGLPGMDGFEFSRRIRALPQGKQTIILAVTAYDASDYLQTALEAGIDDFLTKPVSRELLKARLAIIEQQISNLTRRKQAEKTLKQNEQWLAAMLKSIGEGVIATNIQGAVTFINPLAESLTGWKQEEVLGNENIFKIIDEETQTLIENPIVKILQEDILINKVNHSLLVNKDGTEIPIEYSGTPIKDDKGNVTGVVLIFHDITERKRTEKELRQLEKAIKTIQLGVTIADIEGRIIYTNPAEAKLHGYQVKDLIGKDLEIFIPSELRKPMTPEQLKKMGTMDRESVNIRKDGSVFPVRLISDVVKNAAGHPIAIVTICEDITQRKHVEQALRMSEQQYRLMAENVANGIGIIQENMWVFVNRALSSMLGFTWDQMIARNPEDFFHQDDKELVHDRLGQMKHDITDIDFQARCIGKEGQEVWTEWDLSPIVWENRLAILATIRDITKNKLKEKAMKEEKEDLQKENVALRLTIKNRYRFSDIIGKSQVMQDLYEQILKASASDTNVIIYGESGTGKDLVAQTIHQMSKRREKAFVPVNCGAIPDALFESEFFGHRKGAFTGADRDTRGFFDAAHQGTLFLDEIGELSPVMQVKLLRALEGKGHTPVGDYVIRKPDVRIIAATNRNLEDQLKKGLLREDFFYRINVITITVPPLRDHKEDIPLLIDHFLKFSGTGETRRTLPGELLEILYEYEWPGNVRELQNVLQRCLAGQPLDLTDAHRSPSAVRSHISSAVIEQEPQNLRAAVEEFEKRFILSILERNRWHRGKTARMLGVGRKTLFRKMKNLGLL